MLKEMEKKEQFGNHKKVNTYEGKLCTDVLDCVLVALGFELVLLDLQHWVVGQRVQKLG